MTKKQLNQFDRSSRKAVMRLCYSYIRELRSLEEILDHDKSEKNLAVIHGRAMILRNHIERSFPDDVIKNCKSMYADYRNDFDRYHAGNWVGHQTNKKYGRCLESWQAAKRIRDLLAGDVTIPF